MGKIFNKCIQKNIFSDDFKVGRVASTFKLGDKEDLNNYRPISLLPTAARIFENFLYDHLHKYFTDNEILGKTHSTTLALTNCTSDWLVNTDRSNANMLIFLDIKKAFDTTDHSSKLEKYGICSEELLFFKSYFTNRK